MLTLSLLLSLCGCTGQFSEKRLTGDTERILIADVDSGADDALALAMLCKAENIHLLGVTCVEGNSTIENVGKTACHILEMFDCADVPVYRGENLPDHELRRTLISVYGSDGMGDCGLIHPTKTVDGDDAVSFILDSVKENPGKVEIAVLGPATNIAAAIKRDEEAMRQVKSFWIMGTAGIGQGNATPVAEFNTITDAPALQTILDLGIETVIVPFDTTHKAGMFTGNEMDAFSEKSEKADFFVRAFSKLRAFNGSNSGGEYVDACDPCMASVLIDEGLIREEKCCYAVTCLEPGLTYGQVIFYEQGHSYEAQPDIGSYHVRLITAIDRDGFIGQIYTTCDAKE